MDTEVLKKRLGLRLKELRLAKGLRQEDLEKWDVSYRYYGRMERGLVNPTIETLVKLCGIFGVSLSDLFIFLNDSKKFNDDTEAVTMKLVKIMNEGQNAKIKKLKIFLEEII